MIFDAPVVVDAQEKPNRCCGTVAGSVAMRNARLAGFSRCCRFMIRVIVVRQVRLMQSAALHTGVGCGCAPGLLHIP
jgi:hypothetical protein